MSYTPWQLRRISARIYRHNKGVDWCEAAEIISAYADTIDRLTIATSTLIQLRKDYFVAGGEMSNHEAATLIDLTLKSIENEQSQN
jgi:hypothetical protein